MRRLVFIVCLTALIVAGCAGHRLDQGRPFRLTAVSFSDLPGWTDDDVTGAYPALTQSCQHPTKEWQDFCDGLYDYRYASGAKLRRYLERHLKPYRVTAYGQNQGRITGYYEATLTGTRKRTHKGQVPVYGVPAGYRKDKTYPKRKDIEEDGLDAPVIAWADDPVDLFLMHVQGSGRMETPDGVIHLGFAGSNNRSFTGIGQILKDEGLLDDIGHSMAQIRDWLKDHPRQARRFLVRNDRYIFFREVIGDTPVGTGGVVLTPWRSVAVDKEFIPMHTPIWLDTKNPDGGALQTLVVAQDTGSAIKGGIRADFFFGHGDEALDQAGRMNMTGRYYLLLPN